MSKLPSILVLSLICLSCKGDVGPAGPVVTGNIAGSVYLVDIAASQPNDKSGVTVSIYDNTYTAITNADGQYRLVNVPAGIYDLKFSKAGFFVQKMFMVQFVGGGTLYLSRVRLEQISATSITSLTVTPVDSTRSLHFAGSISPSDPLGRYIFVALSKTPFKGTIPFEFTRIVYIPTFGASTFQYDYSMDYLYNFSTGDTLNAIAYYGGFGEAGINYDPATDQYEFSTPGVALSTNVTFILP